MNISYRLYVRPMIVLAAVFTVWVAWAVGL
jgi:hypothetical protein